MGYSPVDLLRNTSTRLLERAHETAAALQEGAAAIRQLKDRVAELERENDNLRRPFRNVDRLDWQHLTSWIPESGHGKFWKEVFSEIRLTHEQSSPRCDMCGEPKDGRDHSGCDRAYPETLRG
jgi:hypothetical protein